jgi:hypothetical protein
MIVCVDLEGETSPGGDGAPKKTPWLGAARIW